MMPIMKMKSMNRIWVLAGVSVLVACSGGNPDVETGAPTPIVPGLPNSNAPWSSSSSSSPGTLDMPTSAPASLQVIEEADTDCIATTRAPRTHLAIDNDLSLTSLDRLDDDSFVGRDVGDRGVAVIRDSSRAANMITLGVESVRTSAIRMVALSAERDVLSRNLATNEEVENLGKAAAGRPLSVARSGSSDSIVVWAPESGGLRAKVGSDDAELTLEEGGGGTNFASLSIAIAPSPSQAKDGSKFLVMWSLYRTALLSHRAYAALVGPAGIVGLTRPLFSSEQPVTFVRAVSKPNQGALLLANREGEPIAIPIDALGQLAGPAHLLKGSFDATLGGGHDLATLENDDAAIVAKHATLGHVFRRVDLKTGTPHEGWICLDAQPIVADQFFLGGITTAAARNSNGYTILVASANGGSDLINVDSTGR
jgi:hypothetical protein